jgi:hypothetical protein
MNKKTLGIIFASAVLLAAQNPVRAEYTLASEPYIIENLGSAIQTTTQEGRFMFQLSNGEKHALLFFGYTTKVQLIDLNLETGTAVLIKTNIAGRTNSYPVLAANDKFYMFTGDVLPDPLLEYDPKTQIARVAANMTTDKCAQSSAIGDDGKLYFGGCTKGTAAKFDPDTNNFTEFGRIDTANPSTYFLTYTIGSDGHYVYTGLRDCDANTNGGGDQYYLGVYDQISKNSQMFFKGEKDSFGETYKGADGRWYYDRYNYTSYQAGGWYRKYYVIENGAPVEIASPPARYTPTYMRANVLWDLKNAPTAYGYEFDLADIYPDNANNQVTVRWKKTSETAWQSVTVTDFNLAPLSVKKIIPNTTNTGLKLLAIADAYGPTFEYDPDTKQTLSLGRSSSLYDVLVLGNEVYLSGYAAVTYRFDPSKPWSLNSSTTNTWSMDVNPRQVAGFGKYHYYSAVGSDGLIYIGVGHLRDSVIGGSLGWYNPATEAKSSIHISDDSVADLTSALSGSKMIYSTSSNKIFVFDVATKTIEREIIVPGAFYESHNVEIEPGVIFGVTESLNSNFLMFKANIQTGEIISQQTASGASFGSVKDRDRRLILGPDKHLWLFVGNSLYRINPDDYSMQKIIDISSSYILFYGSDIYLYGNGSSDIKRIKNILQEPFSKSDLNQDKSVDSLDLDILKTDFLKLTASLTNPRSDINSDGQCTVRDLGILMSGWK